MADGVSRWPPTTVPARTSRIHGCAVACHSDTMRGDWSRVNNAAWSSTSTASDGTECARPVTATFTDDSWVARLLPEPRRAPVMTTIRRTTPPVQICHVYDNASLRRCSHVGLGGSGSNGNHGERQSMTLNSEPLNVAYNVTDNWGCDGGVLSQRTMSLTRSLPNSDFPVELLSTVLRRAVRTVTATRRWTTWPGKGTSGGSVRCTRRWRITPAAVRVTMRPSHVAASGDGGRCLERLH